MSITRYHLTLTEQINQFGGNPIISGTILSDGTFRALVDFEDADTDFIEQTMEENENILSYSSETL